jgi:GSH-dependent disulfide-bond oxidoreductase
MTGQYGHFHVYAPEPVPYAQQRYRSEALRLLGVLERRLAGRAFLAGDDYGIADMAAYPWINVYDKAPLDLAPFPEVRRWQANIAARPATQRAYALTSAIQGAGRPLDEEARRVLFGVTPG